MLLLIKNRGAAMNSFLFIAVFLYPEGYDTSDKLKG